MRVGGDALGHKQELIIHAQLGLPNKDHVIKVLVVCYLTKYSCIVNDAMSPLNDHLNGKRMLA